MKSTPKPADRLYKIKLKYYTERQRLEITRRLPVDQLIDLSPEMAAVMESHFFGLDLSDLGSTNSATGDETSIESSK